MRSGEKQILTYLKSFAIYCLDLFEINDTKEIKKKIRKDFNNKIFAYESYVNEVILQLIKTEPFKENN